MIADTEVEYESLRVNQMPGRLGNCPDVPGGSLFLTQRKLALRDGTLYTPVAWNCMLLSNEHRIVKIGGPEEFLPVHPVEECCKTLLHGRVAACGEQLVCLSLPGQFQSWVPMLNELRWWMGMRRFRVFSTFKADVNFSWHSLWLQPTSWRNGGPQWSAKIQAMREQALTVIAQNKEKHDER